MAVLETALGETEYGSAIPVQRTPNFPYEWQEFGIIANQRLPKNKGNSTQKTAGFQLFLCVIGENYH